MIPVFKPTDMRPPQPLRYAGGPLAPRWKRILKFALFVAGAMTTLFLIANSAWWKY